MRCRIVTLFSNLYTFLDRISKLLQHEPRAKETYNIIHKYINKNKFDDALLYLERSNNDSELEGYVCLLKGIIYLGLGYPLIAKYFFIMSERGLPNGYGFLLSAIVHLEKDHTKISLILNAIYTNNEFCKKLQDMVMLYISWEYQDIKLIRDVIVETLTSCPRSRAYNILGYIASLKNKPKEACTYYGEALKLSPNDIEIKENLALSLIEIKKYDEAEKYLTEILSAEPRAFNALNSLGMIHAIKSNYKKAVYYFDKAIIERSDIKELYLNMAKALKKLNRQNEANQYLRCAKEL